MADWADEIANTMGGGLGGITNDEISAALRKAKADGWREAGKHVAVLAVEADHEMHREAFIEAGFELLGKADKIEKGES